MPNDLTVPGDVRDRLLKVLRLAEDGVGGERDNAQVMLEKLLRQHSLTMADLLDRSSDRERVWLEYADEQEMTVLLGLAKSVLGGAEIWRCDRPELGFDVTRSQRAELEVAWDTYQRAWRRTRQDVLVAFIGKHRLFDESELARHIARNEEPEDLRDVLRRRRLMNSLEHVDTPRKRVTGGQA